MRVLVLLLLFASVSFGQSIADRVQTFEDAKRYTVKYDKFEDVTRVLVHLQATSYLSLTFRADNKTPEVFWYVSQKRGFFNKPALNMLIDGQLLTIQSGEIGTAALFPLSIKQLETLANAKTVEYQVLPFEGEVKDLQIFKNLLSLTKSQPPAPPK